jgi:hypothetical protein
VTATTAASTATTAKSSGVGGASGGADFCNKLIAANAKVGGIATAAANPSTAKATLDADAQAFADLEPGAPPDVKAALVDMVDLLHKAGDAIANPSAANASAIGDLGTKLSTDAPKLAQYIATSCSAAASAGVSTP